MKNLKERYETCVNEYIKRFCKKQEIDFEFWVDDIGGIAHFGDVLYFGFLEIKYDIDSKQPKYLIIDWLYESIEKPKKKTNYINYTKIKLHEKNS